MSWNRELRRRGRSQSPCGLLKVTSRSYNHLSNFKEVSMTLRAFKICVWVIRGQWNGRIRYTIQLAVSCNIFQLFDVEEYRNLDRSLKVIGNDTTWQIPHDFLFVVQMAISCIACEIKRVKLRFFIPLPFNLHDQLESLWFFSKILTQTARVLRLLDGAKIFHKSLTPWVGCTNVTDNRRQAERSVVTFD